MTFETLAQQGTVTPYETMAASVAQRILSMRKKSVQESFGTFNEDEHRMEYVATVRGVEFINDSKATTVNATWYAFEQMTRPLIWIVGGQDKKNDYSALKKMVEKNVKAIVCLGNDNRHILEQFGATVPVIVETHTATQAVEASFYFAEHGDTVLFSPAAPSFDLFESFEDRGRQFKEAVNEL